jgi:DNA-binding Xre family transcriptional regulator
LTHNLRGSLSINGVKSIYHLSLNYQYFSDLSYFLRIFTNILVIMSRYGTGSTPKEMMRLLAENIRAIRKEQKISQKKLAEISGVTYSSFLRFENTGMISLESLLKICNALGRLDEFETILQLNNTDQKRNLFDI